MILTTHRLDHASQEALLKGLVAGAREAIIGLDGAGRIIALFGGSDEVFGCNADDMAGRRFEDLFRIGQSITADLEGFFGGDVRTTLALPAVALAVRGDGSTFPVEGRVTRLDGDAQLRFVGVVRDISSRVELEADKVRLRDAVEVAARGRALGEVAATLAHELNQPLSAIANYMDALEIRLGKLDGEQIAPLRDIARRAGSQARLGGEIVKRIRRVSRSSEAQVRADQFHEAVRTATSLFSDLALASGVELRVESHGEDGSVAFDRLHLYVVVTNLLRNALTALQHAQIKQLTVTSEVRGNEVELRVCDTGKGVSDDQKSKIFERLISDSMTEVGLGLPIAQRVAAAHSGKIWVEDNPGGGALFRMVFPV